MGRRVVTVVVGVALLCSCAGDDPTTRNDPTTREAGESEASTTLYELESGRTVELIDANAQAIVLTDWAFSRFALARMNNARLAALATILVQRPEFLAKAKTALGVR